MKMGTTAAMAVSEFSLVDVDFAAQYSACVKLSENL